MLDSIREELNVKEVDLVLDDSHFVSYTIKPNFRVLGKKVGKQMKEVQDLLSQFDSKQIEKCSAQGGCILKTTQGEIHLDMNDVVIERSVREGIQAESDGHFTVAFDMKLTPELEKEGLAREIVNKLNTMRRELDLDVSDRIQVVIEIDQKAKAMLEEWLVYIVEETLATSLQFALAPTGQEWDVNGFLARISIEKDQSYGR